MSRTAAFFGNPDYANVAKDDEIQAATRNKGLGPSGDRTDMDKEKQQTAAAGAKEAKAKRPNPVGGSY